MMQETEEMERDTRQSLAPRQSVSAMQVDALLTTSSLTLLYHRLLNVMLDLVEEEHSNADTYHDLGGIAGDLLEAIQGFQSTMTPPQNGT